MPQPIRFGLGPPAAHTMGTHLGGNRYMLYGSKKQDPAPAPPQRPSANKRRKTAPSAVSPAEELLSVTMEPLNVTIVARCVLAHSLPSGPAHGSAKKRSNRGTPTASPTPPAGPPVHPYSRHSDLANTRSTIPSPHELARAERMEEEKARQKKENAAAARAAAAIARRRRALRSGGRGTPRPPSISATPASMIPPIQRAVAAQRARSAEAAAAAAAADAVVAPTAGFDLEDDPAMSLTSRALKRTRSSGLNGTANGTSNGGAVGSPLRTVTNHPADDDAADAPGAPGVPGAPADADSSRKRSRLAESTVPSPSRRAASASPQATSTSLSDAAGKTTLDPSSSPDAATSMRRVVSATDTVGLRRAITRTGSATPDGVRERSRREVQLPARLRE